MTPEERQGWLEAIKELKAEYMIGSRNAFYYLKHRRVLEDILSRIRAADPAIAHRHNLTTDDIETLSVTGAAFLNTILGRLSIEHSTVQYPSVFSTHSVRVAGFLEIKDDPDEQILDIQWELDPYTFLLSLLKRLPLTYYTQPYRKASRTIYRAVSQGYAAGEFGLRFIATNESIYSSQLTSHPQYLHKDIASTSRTFEEAVFYLVGSISNDLSERQWKTATNIAHKGDMNEQQHLFLKRIGLRANHTNLDHIIQATVIDFKEARKLADDWLFDSSLYQRASSEYTLYYIETKRRIVLNYVRDYEHLREKYTSSEFVERLLSCAKKRIFSLKKRIQQFRDSDVPALVETCEIGMKEAKYTYLALHQNKKWLVEFLSR